MKSNQDLPAEVREMLIVAVFWDWRLRSLNISTEEWLLFRRWHSVPAHRVMLDRVHALRKQQASARLLSSLAETSSQPAHARQWLRAAASVLVFLLAQFGPSGSGTLPPYQILETASAASTRPLKDGSIVRAAPNTRIEIQLSRSERALSLFRGQAFFDVAHESGRAFVVRTPDAIIEATGTRFGVSILGAVTVVTVTDGTVNVTPASTQFQPARDAKLARVLNTNEQAQVSQLQAPVVSNVDSETVLAWATTIAFDGVSAVEALQRFSARNGWHLKFKDPGIAQGADISGTFQLDDPMAFAKYVANRTSAIVSVSAPGHAATDVAPRRTAEKR